MTDEETLIHLIATALDHPSIRMEGPSPIAIIKARRILEAIQEQYTIYPKELSLVVKPKLKPLLWVVRHNYHEAASVGCVYRIHESGGMIMLTVQDKTNKASMPAKDIVEAKSLANMFHQMNVEALFE